MALGNDLNAEVRKILQERWSMRSVQGVPESNDLDLGNVAAELEGVVLYADLDDSTKLVDTMKSRFAAKVYKSYLAGAARIISLEDGAITAYDGDRIMAVFKGKGRNDRAVRAALKINFAVHQIINPAIADEYPDSPYKINHIVGIDTSKLFVARTGIRGANNLVWVGRAANYAAKLSSGPGPTYTNNS